MLKKELIQVTRKLKLLYVEDDEVSRYVTLDLLKNFFNNIVVAVDGEEALEKFRKEKFDIILSDINMPKLNGIEMIHEVRKTDKKIPILLLSAHNESEYLLKGIELGVDGYILKPLHLDNFIVFLTKVAERISLEIKNKNYQNTLELEVKNQTKELDKKLHFDELTGLYSRYTFFEDIKSLDNSIVYLLDINKFKTINEIYGTTIGSLILKKFSAFLLNFTSDTISKVYRISGNEFAIVDSLATLNKYQTDIMNFFHLLKNFSVDINEDSISIEVTVGISSELQSVYETAKIALDYAKSHKKSYEMYSVFIDGRSKEQDALAWKEKTKSAIKENRIIPVYQAIVDKNSNIVKYETLMRMKEKGTQKLISPFHFLDIAIKTGLYNTLSSCIIFEALQLLNTSEHTISFNLTYGDVQNMSLLNEIESLLKISPNLGNRTIFEITESENIEDYAKIKNFIKRFRNYGVKFAIDDFGSGFSNFQHILEIEPDYLKIDGSLIKNIDTDKKAYILVEAIVEFSHKLGIKIIAEYVHSKVIFDMLKDLDVDEYQGFYFAEPLAKI